MSDPKRELYHLRGIPVPETPLPGENPAPWGATEVIGKRLPRVDAYERVSGTAVPSAARSHAFFMSASAPPPPAAQT